MKNTAFLTELLITILIFAVCTAVCAGILTVSHTMAEDSKDLNNALLLAESAAEVFKSARGNAESTAAILDGVIKGGVVEAYYDDELNLCPPERALYVLSISDEKPEDAPASLIFGRVSVQKNGGEIISLTAAARGRSE